MRRLYFQKDLITVSTQLTEVVKGGTTSAARRERGLTNHNQDPDLAQGLNQGDLTIHSVQSTQLM